MKSYFNTTNLQDVELDKCEKKAKSQDETILELFKTFDSLSIITPETALKHLQSVDKKWNNVPVTSIRRAFSNLQKNGLIVKSESCLVKGDYGKKVHTWALVKNND